jgi:2-oxoglutarate dehydrogenase N-terminus
MTMLRSALGLRRKGRGVPASMHHALRALSSRPQRESFLNGTSSLYAEQMMELYQQDPSLVHASWKKYFDNLNDGLPFQENDYLNPTTAAAARKVAVRTQILAILPKKEDKCTPESTPILY